MFCLPNLFYCLTILFGTFTDLLKLYNPLHKLLDKSLVFEGLAPLLLRLYLAPVMIQGGWIKYKGFVDWSGNADYFLGLPLPFFLAFLATTAELVGYILTNWDSNTPGQSD
jgi:putative oxidoreductase